MANSIPSRPGLREGGDDAFELLLDVRGGEVLSAYNTAVIMADKHKMQQLRGAKSVKFPAFWNATAEYHVPGTEIVGGQIASQDVTVSPDDKLIAAVFVADVDEALFDVNVRSPYTDAIGRELAEKFDAQVMRAGIKSARSGPLFAEDQGGGYIEDDDLADTADAVFAAISGAKEEMDEKRVPVNSQAVHAVLPTAQWYLLARSDKNLNRDFNGGSNDIRRFTLTTIDDVQVHKSNVANAVFGVDSTSDLSIPEYYRLNLTKTRGLVFTEYAMASVVVQDLGLQMVDQPEKQGVLMIGRRMTGTRALRSKAAVELKLQN